MTPSVWYTAIMKTLTTKPCYFGRLEYRIPSSRPVWEYVLSFRPAQEHILYIKSTKQNEKKTKSGMAAHRLIPELVRQRWWDLYDF